MSRDKASKNRVESLPAGLTVVRSTDKLSILVFVLSLIGCLACVVYGLLDAMWVSLPFVIAGLFYMVFRRNYIALIIVVAILAVIGYFTYNDHDWAYLYIAAFITCGAVGVASIVDAIQRVIFYRVLSDIRFVNVSQKPKIRSKLMAFLFSVPHDLDTRNIMADLDIRSRKFPWKDLGVTIGLSMVVGMFFWIYISFNPSFVNLSDTSNFTVTDSSLLMFTVMLYVPVIIMPFSIFRSMNVRIGTNFRDFKLYNGAVSTIQRMAVPVAAALIFIILAVSTSRDLVAVLVFIGISATMILLIVSITSIIYFYGMEATIVSSIARKWKLFMPVSLLDSLKERAPEEDFPGTPARDENDVSDVVLRKRKTRS